MLVWSEGFFAMWASELWAQIWGGLGNSQGLICYQLKAIGFGRSKGCEDMVPTDPSALLCCSLLIPDDLHTPSPWSVQSLPCTHFFFISWRYK